MKLEVINDMEQESIKLAFKARCRKLGIPFKSRSYYQEQATFISGVGTTLALYGKELPAFWMIACMSNREILDNLN